MWFLVQIVTIIAAVYLIHLNINTPSIPEIKTDDLWVEKNQRVASKPRFGTVPLAKDAEPQIHTEHRTCTNDQSLPTYIERMTVPAGEAPFVPASCSRKAPCHGTRLQARSQQIINSDKCSPGVQYGCAAVCAPAPDTGSDEFDIIGDPEEDKTPFTRRLGIGTTDAEAAVNQFNREFSFDECIPSAMITRPLDSEVQALRTVSAHTSSFGTAPFPKKNSYVIDGTHYSPPDSESNAAASLQMNLNTFNSTDEYIFAAPANTEC